MANYIYILGPNLITALILGPSPVFTSAFIHAAFIQRHYTSIREELKMKNVQTTHWPDELKVIVSFDVVDTAPDNSQKIDRGDGLRYQKSHRDTNAHEEFIPDYVELMSKLHSRYGVGFVMTNQSDLMSSAHFRDALLVLLHNIEELSVELAPEKEALALRRACPVEGCGIAEKHGIRNRYNLNGPYTAIDFDCPDHGLHQVSLANLDEIKTLEMNTPMLLKIPIPPVRLHKRVTGADYAGFYQEQLLWRQFFRLDNVLSPYISYAPLITDWAGSKISKSLYVKNGAYKYLEESKMDWLLSYQKTKERGVDIEKVFDVIEGWMQDPNEYFRPHTVDSLQMMHFNDRDELSESIEKFLIHDGEVHDPLGGGAYVYGTNLLIAIPRYLGIIPPTVHFSRNQAPPNAGELLPPCILSIHIDVTHNDPNVGVLINTILPFVLGRALKDDPRNPITQVEVVVMSTT
ncbi:hypothetical protein QCA50_000551 [Cerrena zonata]|uniref:Uncharacterized protein n=1 Tax=Cerrena zonata TaxID=2478898 RepID=A0AAW0GUW6_9APHY